MKAGNTLTQRSFRKPFNEVIVKMCVDGMQNGQKAGLCHFSSDHSAIGVAMEDDVLHVEFRRSDRIERGPELARKPAHVYARAGIAKDFATEFYIWFRSTWGLDGESHYSYSLDGINYTPFGEPYRLQWGNYRGDRIGIYTFNDDADTGYIDVDYFHYR